MLFQPRYNLVLVCNRNMKPADFESIGEIAEKEDPFLKAFVLRPRNNSEGLFSELNSRPTLVFSPWEFPAYLMPRGKVYCGKYVPKIEQMKIMRQQGIPVPNTAIVKPGSRFSEREWGPYVVVKPFFGSFSLGVEVRRPEDVTHEWVMSKPREQGISAERIVQRFVDTGPFRPQIRVLTLFGHVLYAEEIRSEEPLPAPTEINEETLKTFVITSVKVKRTRRFVYEEDVMALASRVHRAFPKIPLLGVDIIREDKTGNLFVLETNASGNTWHFSSKFGQYQRVEGKKRDEQFNAFSVAARILAEKTKNEAI